MHNRSSAHAAAFATGLFAVAACGAKAAGPGDSSDDSGSTGDSMATSTSDSGATSTTTATHCSWPASLDPPMSALNTPHCAAAVAALYCNTEGGGGEHCLSNDPSKCSDAPAGGASSSSGGGSSSTSDAGGTTCVNQCTNDEYAVGCYPPPALGPMAGMAPQPPSTCRIVNGGSAWYCCPCGQ